MQIFVLLDSFESIHCFDWSRKFLQKAVVKLFYSY